LLSNLSDDKGLDIALSLLRAAKSAGLDVVLHLAGPASTAKAAADIATAKQEFGSALDVAGPLSGPAKAAFYKRIDVFLFPSRYRNEAQPLVVLEAMANGLPVIVSNRGYIAELVGTTGVIVADPRAFVSITMELCRVWVTNPDVFRHRANGSRERFLELHRIAVADFKSLLGRIVRRNSAEPAKCVP
jgi:glycosyltransferase involved in cell wall biosynthesis